jgi:hypothetical protein
MGASSCTRTGFLRAARNATNEPDEGIWQKVELVFGTFGYELMTG